MKLNEWIRIIQNGIKLIHAKINKCKNELFKNLIKKD